MNTSNSQIAHYRKYDQTIETVDEHLINVSKTAGRIANKLNLSTIAQIVGLMHDVGKYSPEFQNYIKSATGLLNENDKNWVDASKLKGSIDHSTAGAQLLAREIPNDFKLISEFLCLPILSHHSGLIDVLDDAGCPILRNRMSKNVTPIQLPEHIKHQLNELLTGSNKIQIEKFIEHLKNINLPPVPRGFTYYLIVKYLLSCLVEADRLETANFEHPIVKTFRNRSVDWNNLLNKLEDSTLPTTSELDKKRKWVSDHCLKTANKRRGLFTLTVPTGGGKTRSSLRFALAHAKKHKLKRIIYVIPFTSIIDQNAEVTKEILGDDVVLEHHSNLILDENTNTWRHGVLCEDWDAPVIFTTAVQFMNAIFDSRCRNARRFSAISDSVIIFDEIQSMPIKLIHMFNNSINFITKYLGSSVILCSATQPHFHAVNSEFGALNKSTQIVPYKRLFKQFKRVNVQDKTKPNKWDLIDISNLIMSESENGSVLYIANTKKMARDLYDNIPSNKTKYHLSTNMCPKHRKSVLKNISSDLKSNKKIICISTQLIEAGVDVDFNCVIRSLAGLDSICQAAGRCNRNGKNKSGSVYIINPLRDDENVEGIIDIKKGQEFTQRILDNFKINQNTFDNDLIGIKALDHYYKLAFYGRKDDMLYNVSINNRQDNLLNLLSINSSIHSEYKRLNGAPYSGLRQSFKTAEEYFKVIDSDTTTIIVPYDQESKDIIQKLQNNPTIQDKIKYIKQLQQYQLNLFKTDSDFLTRNNEIYQISDDVKINVLSNTSRYDSILGFSKN